MWTKLAADGATAEKAQRFFFNCRGRRVACTRLRNAAYTAAATEQRSRFEINWLPSIRRRPFKKGVGRLRTRTSRSSGECSDVHWPGRRFHSGGAQSGPEQWLSFHHSRSHYFAGRNRGDLLPECALLRIVSCTCVPLKWRPPRCRRSKCWDSTARVPPIIAGKCKASQRRNTGLEACVAHRSLRPVFRQGELANKCREREEERRREL